MLRKRVPQAGFTLLEVLLVTGLIGVLFALVIPSLRGPKESVKDFFRHMISMTRQVRNEARLSESPTTYRIVFNMDDDEGHTYWVESKQESMDLALEPDEGELELPQLGEDDDKTEDEAGSSKLAFASIAGRMGQPKALPRGWSFHSVQSQFESRNVEAPGRGYLHFLSNGMVEQIVLQITDGGDRFYSLVFYPLETRPEIVRRKVDLGEVLN